ncbi:bifunctional methylenetetrahydrofolate dehydrogenase/methenyltetrahydrofolate cyclohydrolase FolD [Steroidobacter sp.]|uniref:bifunctional methylenetetrahydrofolate dehydrogenase/methenyltetrahydrofolate cyclohydrolase FolD n=1 Tax=Steroidobacter sp. TaxID=1978227 RepID=UPI001A500BBF|nr:bifunctional methylenetetrahydrofolate dehydrogenase/methenyltetrahydrofolate cyclohydrolase FolD [Steroidobacter sp.]MBL8269173.1 bifunctional methylenetetrahydrofolate dehydrogenase/methenyltetrahydrofolate cyclohydrolase FolD [Steroidobacter sp.]
MTATLIDGRAVAERLRERVAARTAELAQHGLIPGLAVVLVGEDPASQVYVGSKTKQAAAAGLRHFDHRLPATTSTAELIALVEKLNAQADVHGILVQLPLPAGVDSAAVLAAIDPDKDVDGFHAVNAGRLALGQEATVPCTPLGCLILIREATRELAGKRAVVVGRSNIVGKPMAQLLLQNDCTVTIAHSRTRDLAQLCREADILVAAIGRPKAIAGDWIRPGAIVIDVGINRIVGPDGKNKLVGDVDFEAALPHAGAITPVPGGVGPMTIACLLMNTVNAAIRSKAGAVGAPLGVK